MFIRVHPSPSNLLIVLLQKGEGCQGSHQRHKVTVELSRTAPPPSQTLLCPPAHGPQVQKDSKWWVHTIGYQLQHSYPVHLCVTQKQGGDLEHHQVCAGLLTSGVSLSMLWYDLVPQWAVLGVEGQAVPLRGDPQPTSVAVEAPSSS